MNTIISSCKPHRGLRHYAEVRHEGIALHQCGKILRVDDTPYNDMRGHSWWRVYVRLEIEREPQLNRLIGLVKNRTICNLYSTVRPHLPSIADFELRDVREVEIIHGLCAQHGGIR